MGRDESELFAFLRDTFHGRATACCGRLFVEGSSGSGAITLWHVEAGPYLRTPRHRAIAAVWPQKGGYCLDWLRFEEHVAPPFNAYERVDDRRELVELLRAYTRHLHDRSTGGP